MSKSAAKGPKGKRKSAGAEQVSVTSSESGGHATRETVESVVIAVILAFLFRAFIAEAFVIPTGSMAPTLQGRHIDVACKQCGYGYRTGASVENQEPGRLSGTIVATTCPVCRYRMQLDRHNNPNERSFTGDRILVSKFAYYLSDPKRWDVIVFKYPGNAKQNYIKRLVGLPGEMVMIHHGNIYVAKVLYKTDKHLEQLDQGVFPAAFVKELNENGVPLSDQFEVEADMHDPDEWTVTDGNSGETYLIRAHDDQVFVARKDFRVARKRPRKLLAMLQPIDDTRYIPDALIQVGWPSRWQQWSDPVDQRRWQVQEGGHQFAVEGGEQVAWLRYRHLVPWESEWDEVLEGNLPERLAGFKGQLISDYYAYNDGIEKYGFHEELSGAIDSSDAKSQGMHWVGDLAVQCDVEVKSQTGQLLLDLVEGGVHYQCRINLENGQARLSIDQGKGSFTAADGSTVTQPTGKTKVRGPGKYRLRFSNVDDELLLWVNNRLIRFDGPTTYQPDNGSLPSWSPQDAGDLEPIGIGSVGADLLVTRLRVHRDVYYVAHSVWTTTDNDYLQRLSPRRIREVLADPSTWNDEDSLFRSRRSLRFALDRDQFFPLGDNSPQSKDARLWSVSEPPYEFEPPPSYVSRELLTGKALLIYWPHAWRRPIPFFPNFRRMGVIR